MKKRLALIAFAFTSFASTAVAQGLPPLTPSERAELVRQCNAGNLMACRRLRGGF